LASGSNVTKISHQNKHDSLIFPVLKTIDDCRISWGAASRKASKVAAPKASCFSLRIRDVFFSKLVSISSKAKDDRKFLEKKKLNMSLIGWLKN
jgi:hypothetical protein